MGIIFAAIPPRSLADSAPVTSARAFSTCPVPLSCFTCPRRRNFSRQRRGRALCAEIQFLVCQQRAADNPLQDTQTQDGEPSRGSRHPRGAHQARVCPRAVLLNKNRCVSRPLAESSRISERWPQPFGHCATCCSRSFSPRKRTGWGAARSQRARGGQLHRAQDARGRRRPR